MQANRRPWSGCWKVVEDIGTPRLVVHNIDGRVPGIFRARALSK
jgi:hypothetical protein